MPSVVSASRLGGCLGRPSRLSTFFCSGIVFVMALSYLLLSMAPCMVSGACYHGYQSAFSFDADKVDHPAWMKDLPDDVPLSSLSIPGTHDTMTYDIDDEGLECQTLDLAGQLEAGLRYFDIRARLRDDELQIYHGDGYTGFSLQDVLVAMFAFLDANPSEALVVRLKQEAKPVGDKNTITFEQAFNRYREDNEHTAKGAAQHLYLYDGKAPLPSLGELRSKLIILQQFPADKGPYGVEWEGPQMVLEDLWVMQNVSDLPKKWTAIRDALELAGSAPLNNSALYLAHVSASVGVLPVVAAAGPLNRTYTGMNDETGRWLEENQDNAKYKRTGIVILDFPGHRLIDVILRWNRKL